MDTTLRCNDLKCRALVPDQAVVTTCSHIFCIPCANRLGIIEPDNGHRVCPACNTQLFNQDDAVVTTLNPSEDYKTSVLSGFSPNIIMECAGRGLGFWGYQMAQEITYQEYLARSLAEKYTTLNAQINDGARQSREEINTLRRRLDALHAENQNLIEAKHAADQTVNEKQRAYNRVNDLYRKLKSQYQAAGLEDAAAEDAEQVVRQAASQQQQHHQSHNMSQRSAGKNVHARTGNSNSGGNNERRHVGNYTWQKDAANGYQPSNPPQGYQSRQSSRAGMGSSQGIPIGTQSTQRSRLPPVLPEPTYGAYNHTFGNGAGAGARNTAPRGETPMRSYSNNYGRGGQGGGAATGQTPRVYGVGLSGGMRQGRQPMANVPLSRRGAGGTRPGAYSGMAMR